MLERPHWRNQVDKVFTIFCWYQGEWPQWWGEGDLNGRLTEWAQGILHVVRVKWNFKVVAVQAGRSNLFFNCPDIRGVTADPD